MPKKTKEEKQAEKIEKLKEEKPFKYSKVEEYQYDLNERLRIALQNGYDPLGYMTITEIYQDIQTVNKLKGLNLEESEEE